MCECGCGELRPLAKIPAPDGGWYFLEVYPGCVYCMTTWALGVTRCSKEEASESFWKHIVEDAPTAEFNRYEQWGAPILDTGILKREFMEETGEEDDFAEAPFALSEFVSRGGLIRVYDQTRQAAPLAGGEDRRTEGPND